MLILSLKPQCSMNNHKTDTVPLFDYTTVRQHLCLCATRVLVTSITTFTRVLSPSVSYSSKSFLESSLNVYSKAAGLIAGCTTALHIQSQSVTLFFHFFPCFKTINGWRLNKSTTPSLYIGFYVR